MRATQSCVGSGRPVGPRQPRSPWVPPQSGGMLAEHGALGGPFTPAHAVPTRPIATVTAATASVAATQPFDIIPPREHADIRLSRSRAAFEYAIEGGAVNPKPALRFEACPRPGARTEPV